MRTLQTASAETTEGQAQPLFDLTGFEEIVFLSMDAISSAGGGDFGTGGMFVLERGDVPGLFSALKARKYHLLGPVVRDGAIVYDEIASDADLPSGWTDEQEGGKYRRKSRPDEALFGYAVGPHSWKKFLFPPATRLWSAQRQGSSFQIASEETNDPPKYAFIGVRSC